MTRCGRVPADLDWVRTPIRTPELQDFARGMLAGDLPASDTRCLTLLGTAGEEAAWNSTRESVAHRAIPLVSKEMVANGAAASRDRRDSPRSTQAVD